MKLSEATQLLTDFTIMGGKAVTLAGGGEPTAHPDLISIIACAYGLGLDCGLITNGHYLADGYASALTSWCRWIRVSIDGSETTYQSRHGNAASWSLTYDHLCQLAQTDRQDCTVGASYLLSASTAYDAIDAAKAIRDSGADYIQFKPFDGDNYDPTNALDSIRAQLPDFQVYGFFQHDTSPTRSYSLCHAANFIIDVSANGDVNKCCAWRAMHKPSLGNIVRDGLEATLSSDDFTKAMKCSVSDCPTWCRNHALNETVQRFCIEPMEHNNFV
jgi:MoaA/NifB/PqqE/SkfB family radical SAM enzyme